MNSVAALPFSEAAPSPAVENKRHLPLLSVERLLREQQSLTAVETFSRRHDLGELVPQSKLYRNLIPLDRPGADEQYAFEVDLDACTGCKACVAGCHNLNGLDEAELWRNVGLLHGGTVQEPALQTITTSCHHCLEPACMAGCPVKAYEKDSITGIVKHLDDQCIGCQYCTLMCPYDAPKYNKAKGIVRKCDMCSERLAKDEAPACVQSCPNEAIAIRVVSRGTVVDAGNAQRFLPGTAVPEHTLPSTSYKTKRPMPSNMLPVDFYRTHPEHGHPPLVLMLTLTQLSVGAFTVAQVSEQLSGRPIGNALAQTGFAWVVGVIALVASVFHLGRPLYAWRALLGLRTSWLSREALCFGLFVKLTLLYALFGALPSSWAVPSTIRMLATSDAMKWAAISFGMSGVFCSVMVYVATRRQQWSGSETGLRFFGTTLGLGAAAVVAVASWEVSNAMPAMQVLLWVVGLTTGVKLAFECAGLLSVRDPRESSAKRMAKVMLGDLMKTTTARFALGLAGGILLPLLLVVDVWDRHTGALLAGVSFATLLFGELAERSLFFSAAPTSRMPGGLR